MSATPCESNDNLLLDLGLNRRQSTQNNVGSGCNDAGSTTEANQENDMQVTDPEVTPTFSASSVATFLSCTTTDALDLTNSNDVERIELAYDYDIQVTNTADLSFAVSVFELDLLKVIADESGLSSCAFGRRSLRHGRRKLNSTGASSLVLGGIGSNPADVVDTTRSKYNQLLLIAIANEVRLV
jgi:hypothetical protein